MIHQPWKEIEGIHGKVIIKDKPTPDGAPTKIYEAHSRLEDQDGKRQYHREDDLGIATEDEAWDWVNHGHIPK